MNQQHDCRAAIMTANLEVSLKVGRLPLIDCFIVQKDYFEVDGNGLSR